MTKGFNPIDGKDDTMTTLVIHSPDYRVRGGAKSFEAILKDGVGVGYAIFQKDINKPTIGDKVILLRKDRRKKRAEGIFIKFEPTDRYTAQGIRRYDVYIKGLIEIPYKSEPLNRFGVGIL